MSKITFYVSFFSYILKQKREVYMVRFDLAVIGGFNLMSNDILRENYNPMLIKATEKYNN